MLNHPDLQRPQVFTIPWIVCGAPVGLFLSVISDLKAKEVQKMSVKGTWKVLMSLVVLPILHFCCVVAISLSFGEVPALVWFFFAPVGAVLAIFGKRPCCPCSSLLLIRASVGCIRNIRKNTMFKKCFCCCCGG